MAASETHQAKRQAGRPPKLSAEEVEELLAIVRAAPSLSLNDIAYALRKKAGVRITGATVRTYLAKSGFKRQKVSRARRAASGSAAAGAPDAPATYGYTKAHRDPGDAARYPGGVTDSEWERLTPFFDPEGRPGRPPKYSRRSMVDAVLYVLRSGCSWRLLPKDFPPYDTVYKTFRRWQVAGLIEKLYDELRALWREREHRAPEPTAGVADSQSIRTSPQGGVHGFDAGKKVKGRKRHLVTDTLGLVLTVIVTAASVQDRDVGAELVGRAKAKYPTLEKVFLDSGYAGACQEQIRTVHNVDADVVRHPANRNVGRWSEGQLDLFDPPSRGFVVQPKRWVVERTNAWNLRPRRLVMDHDRDPAVTEAWIWLAEARRLLRRLCAPDDAATAPATV
jgi:transposase